MLDLDPLHCSQFLRLKDARVHKYYSQLGESSPAHGRGDGLDGREEGVEEHGEAPRGAGHLALLVEHEPRQRHRVDVHLRLRSSLRHVSLPARAFSLLERRPTVGCVTNLSLQADVEHRR